MVRAPLYSADGIGVFPALGAGPLSASRDCLEYSKPHYAGPHSAGAGRGLGDRTSGAMWIAFVLFLVAGVSDAVDGYPGQALRT